MFWTQNLTPCTRKFFCLTLSNAIMNVGLYSAIICYSYALRQSDTYSMRFTLWMRIFAHQLGVIAVCCLEYSLQEIKTNVLNRRLIFFTSTAYNNPRLVIFHLSCLSTTPISLAFGTSWIRTLTVVCRAQIKAYIYTKIIIVRSRSLLKHAKPPYFNVISWVNNIWRHTPIQ